MNNNANVDLTSINLKEMKVEATIQKNDNASITVVGVGGGGNNMINHLCEIGTYPNIRLVIANTDLQHMKNNPAQTHILLGEKTTQGLGAGMRPEIGRKAAEESYDKLKEVFEGSDLVIISAGLGGGTGTGATPIIASAAKEVGALTIAVVTTPFKMEGKKRAKLAQESLVLLKEVCDSIIIIPNQRLLNMIDKNTSYEESMSYVDDVLARAVNGIANIILAEPGDGINLDFADLRTVVAGKGLALISIGEAEGDDAAQKAVSNAIESPLFEDISIKGSMAILISFEVNPKFPFVQITQVVENLQEVADENADIIFGTVTNPNFPEKRVCVSIITTGFQQAIQHNVSHSAQPASSPIVESSEQINNKTNTVSTQADLFPHQQESYSQRIKVSNSDYSEDDLEAPAYFRHQQD
ncbi:cell division protein FtsZ [Helicobacter aurati]|uniref:Cell division protein FtsZ n=1 Tax=Helicobacter aurati TaxID=137778 RepID=A0A3D8J574_9HELI|nr:cell division protein FtsZ [Helicobacter aurati]RDU72295.1 cell division protein FtsZ [Helicobacter aurati]